VGKGFYGCKFEEVCPGKHVYENGILKPPGQGCNICQNQVFEAANPKIKETRKLQFYQ